MKGLLFVPYTFVLLNWAAIKALHCYLARRSPELLWDGGSRSRHPSPETHPAPRS